MAFTWAVKRRVMFLAIAGLIFGVAVFLFSLAIFYHQPTCGNGKQDQGELGVDCGGPCSGACQSETAAPIVHWVRVFRVREGIYSVLAYIENPNVNIFAGKAPYLFKLYDSEDVLVYEIRGETFIPARKAVGIFEGAINVGSRKPTRATFEFSESPEWRKSLAADSPLEIGDEKITDEDTAPTITAGLHNKDIAEVDNVEATVIVYDAEGKPIAASETMVDRIGGGESYPLVFAWPEPFPGKVGRLEILYKVAP